MSKQYCLKPDFKGATFNSARIPGKQLTKTGGIPLTADEAKALAPFVTEYKPTAQPAPDTEPAATDQK